MSVLPLALLLLLPLQSAAHLALWHPSMFGFDGDVPGVIEYNTNRAVHPLKLMDHKTTPQWFGNGLLDFPPAPDTFLQLLAGGTFNGEVSCNRGQTTFRDPRMDGKPLLDHACDNVLSMHTVLDFGDAVNASLLGGCALSISYVTSDVKQVKPSDFTVISTNSTCGWWRETDFDIPANLPACPKEGCLCAWNWVHTAGNFNAKGRGEGYGSEMNNLLYHCSVTGAVCTTSELSVGPGQIANECSTKPSNCTVGPKQPHYWAQADGNNNFSPDTDPPLHNMKYGFRDGAQEDIFVYHAAAPPPVAPVAASSSPSSATRVASTLSATPDFAPLAGTTTFASSSSSPATPSLVRGSSRASTRPSAISSLARPLASSISPSTSNARPSALSALSLGKKHRAGVVNGTRAGQCRPKVNPLVGGGSGSQSVMKAGMHRRRRAERGWGFAWR